MTRKLIVNDGRAQRELLLVGTMVIGRDPTCDVSDADPLLSRRHAEFVVGPRGVSVRDLSSRNGILINGVKVPEATLRPGDIVQVGHLQVHYVEETPATAAMADAAADGDATIAIRPASPAPRSPSPPVTAPAAQPDEEKTRMIAPPRPARSEPPPPASQPVPVPVAGGADEDGDKTRFISRPDYRPPAGAPAPVAPPAAAAAKAVARREAVARPAVAPVTDTPVAPHVARRPWTMFVFVQVAALAAIVFFSVEIPMSLWQTRVLNATAESRASALVNWLAADAAAALSGGASAANAADAVAREAGVVNAMILSPEGRILAPASRSDETITTIPGVGAKAEEVLRLRRGWNGQLFEIARPVQVQNRRGAVVWVTFRPSAPDEAGSGAVVLAVPVIIALIATYLVSMLISRRTLRALTTLNEDIELAVGGKLDAIGDPLGAKPVKDLSDAVNYLIARLRAASSESPGRPDLGARLRPAVADHRAEPQRAAAPSVAAAPAPVTIEARIVASPQFRVTDASPGCADLLGARPDALIGEHLIDAIPDRQIGDAVMRCLSALKSDGEQRTSVASSDGASEIAIVVTRTGRDQPIRITFTSERRATA